MQKGVEHKNIVPRIFEQEEIISKIIKIFIICKYIWSKMKKNSLIKLKSEETTENLTSNSIPRK